MKLKTSFFNPAVLKKDITRFAPLWVLYTILQLLFVLLAFDGRVSAHIATTAPDILMAMGAVNMLYAILTAAFLFGDLFKSRMANAIHALPFSREGLFFTHLTAGFLFSLVPNLLGCLLASAFLGSYCYAAFLWLLVMVLQFLFFFGVATFSMHCAGNLLGAIAIYGIFNLFSVLAGWLVTTFYEPMLYGIAFKIEDYAVLSPIVRFSQSAYLKIQYNNMSSQAEFLGFVKTDWTFLLLASAIGLVLLTLSLLIYRKRQLESAGDFISFRPAAPVFLILYTLCGGAVLYLLADLAAESLRYVFLAIGFGVGFFTGKMLLERKTKVFGKKNLLAFVIFLAVFIATLTLTFLDPLGITRYVPEKDEVVSVSVSFSASAYRQERDALLIEKEEDIQTVLTLHQDCIDNRAKDRPTYPLFLRYTRKNGATVERLYYVNTSTLYPLQQILSRPTAVFGGYTPQAVQQNLRMIEVYSYEHKQPQIAVATNQDYLDINYYKEKYGMVNTAYISDNLAHDPLLEGLFTAIEQDCMEGNMAQLVPLRNNNTYASAVLHFLPAGEAKMQVLDLYIPYSCENTIAFLSAYAK